MIKVPGTGTTEERLAKLEQSVNFSPMVMGIAAVGGDDAGGSSVGAHALLSSTHDDTVANAVTRGSLIYGNSTPAWDELVIGAAGRFLGSDGTDVSWTAPGALTKVDDTNVTLTLGGTPTTALLRATSLTLGWTGTLAAGRLNSNVVQGVTNDTNVTGSISAQNLTLGWTGQLAISRGGTGLSALGTGVQTWLGTPSSANLRAALTDETGTGAAVFADTPTLVTPVLGTPTSGTLTNCTGLPVSTGISGLGTGIATWLATPSSANLRSALTDETGSGAAVFADTPTLVTPVLGTPTSGTLTNCTGLPISTGVSGLGTGVATFLATPSSANLASAVTGETGSGALVFGTSPTFTTDITTPAINGSGGLLNSVDELRLRTGLTSISTSFPTQADYYAARQVFALTLTGALNTVNVVGATGTVDDQSSNFIHLFTNAATISRSTSGTAFSTVRVLWNTPTFQANGIGITSGACIALHSNTTYSVTGGGTIAGVTDDTVRCNLAAGASTTIALRRGLDFADATGSGAVTLQVGVDIEALSKATTNIGIRNASTEVATPTVKAITATTDTIPATAKVIRLNNTSGSSKTLASTPTIANGQDGQLLIIFNSSANDVVIQDQGTLPSSNLRLVTSTVTIGPRDSVMLLYSSDIGDWIQIGTGTPTTASGGSNVI